MLKKYVVIHVDNKPIFIAPLIDGTTEEYLKIKKEVESNRKDYNEKQNALLKRIADLEHEIKVLKGEEEEDE